MSQKIFKPVIIFIWCLLLCNYSFSFSIVKPAEPVSTINFINAENLKVVDFIKLSAKDFTSLTGQKLNFFQKIYFKILQHHVKRELKRNPGLSMTQSLDTAKEKFKFDLLWFIIGAFIGPLGVLLAYTNRNPKDKSHLPKYKKTSAWLGFLVFILWFGLLFIF